MKTLYINNINNDEVRGGARQFAFNGLNLSKLFPYLNDF